jgi:N-acetylglucosamine-6-sulfatase
VLAGIFTCVVIAGCGGKSHFGRQSVDTAHHGPQTKPNIVFVLTDDLSMDLLRFMPHVQAMERQGMTFKDYFVSDSLCCPSRASLFTGNFPHNTDVLGNSGPRGGFQTFYDRGEERHTFAVTLRRAGYRTAMMGKYLNGYMQSRAQVAAGAKTTVSATYVPPGWNEWDVAGWGYPEFNYSLNQNGTLHAYGDQPSDYLTDVLAQKGAAFIDHEAQSGKPFFLELATFAPHAPYTPAPRNVFDFPDLKAPRPPNFGVVPTHPPRWLRGRRRLTRAEVAHIDSVFRLRAQAVEAVDELIGQLEAALRSNGISRQTYVFFSSDNGLHTGEYRLLPGKLTAFDTDIHVPLVVTGPAVPAGATTSAITENIDLAKTFSAIGGTELAGDGQSLLPLLEGQKPYYWRNAILVEHRGPRLSAADPDFQQPGSGTPLSYEAIRTHNFLYVEYADGEREFYDLRTDPFELHNVAYRLSRRQLALLHRELRALSNCRGAQACSSATHVQPAIPSERRRR